MRNEGLFWLLPKASFGLRVLSLPALVCLCVRVSVRPSVRQLFPCPRDNLCHIQARITKMWTRGAKHID